MHAARLTDWHLGEAALALGVMLVALGGCGGSTGGNSSPQAVDDAEKADEDAIVVKVDAVVEAPISALYTTSATLRAEKEATVTSRTRGVIRGLAVEEGDRVKEGQPLAFLEDDEQKIELDRASTTRDTKRREYERAETLHGQGLLSQEAYETIRREAEESKHAARLAQLNVERTVILAPFAGTILRRHLDDGGNVSDGTAVYDLADLDPLYADVSVPERQVASLAVGQTVRLLADAAGTETRARIERIAPVVDATTGTVKVTLAVQERSSLKPGGFVRVEIVTATHDRAAVVPRAALVAEGRQWHVFRVGPDGDHVQRVQVGLGFEEGDRVEILPAGSDGEPLRPGDRVVIVGASALSDDARIRVATEGDEGSDPAGDDPRVAT